MYSCKKCSYTTERKYNYSRHIEKCINNNEIKKSLDEKSFPEKNSNQFDYDFDIDIDNKNKNKKDIIKNYVTNQNINICIYCNKNFVRKDTLIRHINSNCKKNKLNTHNDIETSTSINKNNSNHKKYQKSNKLHLLENTINKQQNMIENLSKILEKTVDKVITNQTISNEPNHHPIIHNHDDFNKPTQIINNIQNQQNNYYQKKQINNTINQTYNNNQQNTFYNNIYINDYGKEDLSYITKDMLNKLIQKPNKSIEEFTRLLHFHQDHPENVNVLIFSKRINEVAVFRDGKWHLKKKDNFLEGFIGDKFDQLYDIFDTHKDQIENEKIEKFEKYADKFGKLNGKERDVATEDVKNLISSESYYYSGHYQKTKKQIQKEIFENTGKIIPTSNIIKQKRPDEDTIGFIDTNPLELINSSNKNTNPSHSIESHIQRIKNI